MEEENMKATPPKLMRLRDVPRYIRTKHGPDFTRQTIYNWASKGVKGTKLKTMKVGCYIRTTKTLVDKFLSELQSVR